MIPSHAVTPTDRPPSAPEMPVGLPERERSVPDAPLVLIVEDEQNAREGLTEFLLAHGFRVTDAKDGAEALQKAEAFRPDAVLLDLALPKTDGWTVARRLKSDEKYGRVPVLAMSALDYPEEVRRAYEAGCDAFLPKPFDLRRLVPTLEQIIARRS